MKRALALAAAAAVTTVLFVPAPAFAQAGSAHMSASTSAPAYGPPTRDADATAPALPHIQHRSAAAFAAQARALDPALATAVTRDLRVSAAQYLADAAAAQEAGALVEALRQRTGAHVDATIAGTAVTVYAADAQTAALARSAGAEAVVGAQPQHDLPDVPVHPLSDVYGGQPYFIGTAAQAVAGQGFRCSAAFPGYAVATGAPQLLSAGHCYTAGTSAYELAMTAPAKNPSVAIGPKLGDWVAGSAQFGSGADSSLIGLTAGHVPQPALLTWGGSTGAPLVNPPQPVTDVGPAVTGAFLCKSGSTTGWTCGTVLDTDYPLEVEDDDGVAHVVNSVIATTCSDHGDSGGAAVIGATAVGLVSAGPDLTCGDPNDFSAFYPMVSSGGQSSVTARYSSTWEPAVSVPATVSVTSLTASALVTQGGTISGTVSGATPGDRVTLKLSNESTARTASIVNGAWSVSLAGAPTGATTYTVRATWGRYSAGAAVTGPVQVVAIPTARLAGSDRFDTSVAIAQQGYPTTAQTVYVSTGLNYPDALSAGPAAAKDDAPLLLTGPTLPESVRAEIASLHPSTIVIVGGVNAVTPGVEKSLNDLATTVTRIAGSDRFETSRLLAEHAFGASIPKAFVATGTNFPDALAAGAAAGAQGAPVLLVNGASAGLDAGTSAFLQAKGTTNVTLVGGTTVVSPALQTALTQQGIAVQRASGSDRFETSEVVGRTSFASYSQAYIASGLGFPDALAGSALAAAKHVPLFTVNGTCVPRSVLGDLAGQGLTRAWLLGGTNALAPSIDALASC